MRQTAPAPPAMGAQGPWDCPVTAFGHKGYKVCGTNTEEITWKDGHREVFVIGVNKEVWSITATTDGWQSLGGVAKDFVHAYHDGYNRPTIQTRGSDGNNWCRTWKDGKWNDWHRNDYELIAQREIGERESGADDTYPKRYQIPGYGIVYGVDWCGIFVHWVWRHGGATKIPRMKGEGTAQGHWATYWQKWAKDNKRWKDLKNAAPGDAIVYGEYPQSGHIGVVVGVRKDDRGAVTQVQTVEGNVGGAVVRTGWRKLAELTGRGLKAHGVASPF